MSHDKHSGSDNNNSNDNDNNNDNSNNNDSVTNSVKAENKQSMNYIDYSCDENKYAWIVLNTPDARVNVLGSAMMQALDAAIASAVADQALVAVFCSAKEGQFIAGADIHELTAISSVEEAVEKSQLGQQIFQRITDLACPTVALINGPCMGGGTELALACDWRIITDHKKVSIALPEVRLGIIPGWGGTVRLPRLIGFAAALSLICSGRSVRGRKCLRSGLADLQVNDAFARQQCSTYIAQKILKKKRPKKRKTKSVGIIHSLLNRTAIGRNFVLKKARAGVEAQGGTHYPAPLRVLDLLNDTWNQEHSSALGKETTLFSELSQDPVSAGLQQLFLQNEAAQKQYNDIECPEITHAGIIGAGVMGGGIAWLLSKHGIQVRLKDLEWKALTQAFRTAALLYKGLLKKRHVTESEVALAMSRLSGGLDDIALRHADIIIEAVVENIEVKRTVLTACEKYVDEATTICSNTSSLCLSAMTDALAHPQRFVGMHFFNPVNRMPLVEIIANEQSDHIHVARVVQVAVKMGKTPVVVKDCAGFLVNRLLTPYMNEAVHLLHDGVDTERIDRLFKEFGMPMGPFALADEVGLDVGYKVACNLYEAYGERMAVAPLLRTLAVDMKLLGKKSGSGFYKYGKKRSSLNKKVQRAQGQVAIEKRVSDADILDRCMLIMVNEAARCLDEGIVASVEELDLAMILGTGFPAFRGGLLHYADNIGITEVQSRLKRLAQEHGSRFDPAAALLARQSFYATVTSTSTVTSTPTSKMVEDVTDDE